MRAILLLFFIFMSCNSPSNPSGTAYSEIGSYQTIDYCRGIDVHGDMLVAAAGANGYMRFRVNDDYSLDSVYFNSDINVSTGDDQAYDVLIAKNNVNVNLVLDDVDGIIYEIYNSEGENILFPSTTNSCANSYLFRSMVLDDSDLEGESVKLFTVQKHLDQDPEGNVNMNAYSTSIGVRTLEYEDVFGITTFIDGVCVALINLDYNVMDIHYSDNLISVTDAGLGVHVFEYVTGELEEVTSFYVQGGYAQSVFSSGNSVIGGFDNDKGCYMVLLDLSSTDDPIINNFSFAEGYSINSIHFDSDMNMLALGTGSDDSVLLYSWAEGSASVSSAGVVDVGSYVYEAKLQDGVLYVASRDGIKIYQIEG